MLVYSTRFPLNPAKNLNDLQSLLVEWICDSPHNDTSRSQLAPNSDGAISVRNSNEQTEFIGLAEFGQEYLGCRFLKRVDSLDWTTDIIARKTQSEFFLGLQLYCDTTSVERSLPLARKPYLIKKLLETLGGGMDDQLLVSDRPHFPKPENIEYIAKLINRTADNVIPVVYVSSAESNYTAVDPYTIAKWLSGLAHVVVEPNQEFSRELRTLTNGSNAYRGAVGIYWPESEACLILLPEHFSTTSSEMEAQIAKILRTSLTTLKLETDLHWSGLQQKLHRKEIDRLQREGNNNLEEYVENFDQELAAKDEEIERLRKQLRSAEQERIYSAARQPSERSGIFPNCSEVDLYDNETSDFVIQVLRAYREKTSTEDRIHHVITSILDSAQFTGNGDKKKEKLKSLLSDYKKMTAPIRNSLQDLGFEVDETGKHIKLTFYSDARYIFTLPKSGSDHRGGENKFSQIAQRLFYTKR